MNEKFLNPVATDPLVSVPVAQVAASYTPEYSLTLVNNTYATFSSARQGNIEPRWTEADTLYFGVVRSKVWPGTNTARAAYPQPVVFDQIETLMPLLEQSIFPDSEDWFEVLPATPLVDEKTGRDYGPSLGRILTANLKHFIDTFEYIGYPSGRREILNAIKQSLLYKLGGVHLRWSEEKAHPVIECVDIRDVFFDPKSLGPSPEMGSAMIWRKLVKVRDLKAYRNKKGWDIPKDDALAWLAMNAPNATPDTSKAQMFALIKMGVTPGPQIYNQNIEDREVEVLCYYNRDRIVWVLNRVHVAYNEPNPYGWYPFAFAPCYEIPHAAYGMSVAELQESSQRLIEALFNGHLDEISLALHPPRIESRTDQRDQDRWGPGQRYFVKTPKDDIQIQTPSGITANVMDSIAYVQQNSYSRSGMNPLQMGGTPTPSNANRTASGMQLQMGGGNNRVYAMVKRYEDYLMVPIIHKMIEMMRYHLADREMVEGVNELGQFQMMNPAIWATPLKIDVKCASRVISRDKIMALVPQLLQFYVQGPLLGELHSVGRTLNMPEIERAMLDATGLGKRYEFTRTMSQQEVQMMRQSQTPRPDPNVQVKAEAAYKTRVDAEHIKAQAGLQKEAMKQQPNPQEIQLEQQKAEMEMQLKAFDLKMKGMELQLKAREGELKLLLAERTAQQKMQQAQMDTYMKGVQSSMQAEQQQKMHQLELFNTAASADQQRDLAQQNADQQAQLAAQQGGGDDE